MQKPAEFHVFIKADSSGVMVHGAQSNVDLKQRLESMAQAQQETLKPYAADSEKDSNAESNGPRNAPSVNSHVNEKEKARRSALQKKVAQLEAANQVIWPLISPQHGHEG